ncbi:hypothetical protein LXL04_022154 [Taraxacum kok-saghyz]
MIYCFHTSFVSSLNIRREFKIVSLYISTIRCVVVCSESMRCSSPVLMRTMVESKTSKNVLRLFYLLGYKLDHELLRVGFAFHFQRGVQIAVTVSYVNKMLKLHATDEAIPVTPSIQLVEVTAPASAENYTDVAAAISSITQILLKIL